MPLRRRGMTLVEILAVVVILGLIAGTLVASLSGVFGRAKHELAKSGIAVIAGKVELYRIETGRWPANDVGLAILSDGHAEPTASYYLGSDQLLDPWGRRYLYMEPGPEGHPYEVFTYGEDGRAGGAGEAADVFSTRMRIEEER